MSFLTYWTNLSCTDKATSMHPQLLPPPNSPKPASHEYHARTQIEAAIALPRAPRAAGAKCGCEVAIAQLLAMQHGLSPTTTARPLRLAAEQTAELGQRSAAGQGQSAGKGAPNPAKRTTQAEQPAATSGQGALPAQGLTQRSNLCFPVTADCRQRAARPAAGWGTGSSAG